MQGMWEYNLPILDFFMYRRCSSNIFCPSINLAPPLWFIIHFPCIFICLYLYPIKAPQSPVLVCSSKATLTTID
jgi:hypothetical protein